MINRTLTVNTQTNSSISNTTTISSASFNIWPQMLPTISTIRIATVALRPSPNRAAPTSYHDQLPQTAPTVQTTSTLTIRPLHLRTMQALPILPHRRLPPQWAHRKNSSLTARYSTNPSTPALISCRAQILHLPIPRAPLHPVNAPIVLASQTIKSRCCRNSSRTTPIRRTAIWNTLANYCFYRRASLSSGFR